MPPSFQQLRQLTAGLLEGQRAGANASGSAWAAYVGGDATGRQATLRLSI